MLKHFILAIFLGIMSLIVYLFTHLGAFKPVLISEEMGPPMRLIYKEHIGAYHKIINTIKEVEDIAKKLNLNCSRSFGEYLDNPDEVDEVRLRSRGGCWVDEFPSNLSVNSLATSAEEFKTQEYPERKYVKAVFEGSPSIGPWKVYSKVISYIKENRKKLVGPVIEVYVIKSTTEMTTTYYFPIE